MFGVYCRHPALALNDAFAFGEGHPGRRDSVSSSTPSLFVFFVSDIFALPQRFRRGKMITDQSFDIHLRADREPFLKISAQLTVIMAAIFAIICFSIAITGFNALSSIADPVQAADAKGFASFWAFLGAIAVVFGALSVWMVRTHKDGEDD